MTAECKPGANRLKGWWCTLKEKVLLKARKECDALYKKASVLLGEANSSTRERKSVIDQVSNELRRLEEFKAEVESMQKLLKSLNYDPVGPSARRTR